MILSECSVAWRAGKSVIKNDDARAKSYTNSSFGHDGTAFFISTTASIPSFKRDYIGIIPIMEESA